MDGACIPAFNRGIEKNAINPNVPEDISASMIPFVLSIFANQKSAKVILPPIICKYIIQ